MTGIPFYPKIAKTKNISHFTYQTYIRIKRNEKWYDVLVSDMYTSEQAEETFKDRLIITKLFWEPYDENSEIAKRIGFTGPSKDQRDIPDDLLSDKARTERIKAFSEIFNKKQGYE